MNAFLAVDAFTDIFLEIEAFSDNFTVVFLSVILDVLYFTAAFLIKIFFLESVFFSYKMKELETDNRNNEILSLKDEILSSEDEIKSSSNKIEEN